MRVKAEEIVIGFVSGGCILISVLHAFHALESVAFLEENIPMLTLLMTGLIGSYLIFERRTKLEELDRLVRDTGRGMSVRRFRSSTEVYDYVSERMQTAKTSIDDMTWGPTEDEQLPGVIDARRRYIRTIRSVGKKTKGPSYREVMSFPPQDRLIRAREMLDAKLPNYSLRAYVDTEGIPLVDCVLFDRSEVVICFYRSAVLPGNQEIRLTTTQPDLVSLFQDYFDTVWHKGAVLQEGTRSYPDKLTEIENRLKESSSALTSSR